MCSRVSAVFRCNGRLKDLKLTLTAYVTNFYRVVDLKLHGLYSSRQLKKNLAMPNGGLFRMNRRRNKKI